MDLPQRIRGFIARDMEDDALGFDPITLVPKAQPASEPKTDLEAEVPPVKEIVSPKVEKAAVIVPEEPTEEDTAEAGTDPDTPVDSSETESEQGLQTTVNFSGS
jgi:hypothetical protein